MAKIGIHATPRKNLVKIRREGLKKIPFWKSCVPARSPKKFRLKYHAFVHVLSGKTRAERMQSVYDALRTANIHVTGSSKSRFELGKISVLFVDLGRASVSKTKILRGPLSHKVPADLEEMHVETGRNALKKVILGKRAISEIENAAKGMNDSDANEYIAERVCEIIEAKMK